MKLFCLVLIQLTCGSCGGFSNSQSLSSGSGSHEPRESSEQQRLPVFASIETLGLKARTRGVLKRAGVLTVGHLLQYSEGFLYFIKGLGPTGVADVKQALQSRNLNLRPLVDMENPFRVFSFDAKQRYMLQLMGINTVHQLLQMTEVDFLLVFGNERSVLDFLNGKLYARQLDIEMERGNLDVIRTRSISALRLGYRTEEVLYANGIKSIEDLVTSSLQRLRSIRGFGSVKERDVIATLHKHGLHLNFQFPARSGREIRYETLPESLDFNRSMQWLRQRYSHVK